MGGTEGTEEGRVGSTWEGEKRLPRGGESLAKSQMRNKNFTGEEGSEEHFR